MRKRCCLTLLLAVLFTLTAIGCNSQKEASYDVSYYADNGYYPEPAEMAVADEAAAYGTMDVMSTMAGPKAEMASSAEGAQYSKKIIYNGRMSMRADDSEAVAVKAQQICEDLGGYISSSYTKTASDGTKNASVTFKIPAESLKTFMDRVAELAEVTESNVSSDDITQSYYDIQARLNSAKAEEEQLLALYAKCTTIEETLQVREQLAYIRSEIESYQTTINLWDNQVSYATLDLSVRDNPKQPVEEKQDLIELWKASDVWQQIKTGFRNGGRFLLNAISGIGIVLSYAIIPLLILGVIGLIVFLIVRSSSKKRAARKAAREAQAQIEKTSAQPAVQNTVPAAKPVEKDKKEKGQKNTK